MLALLAACGPDARYEGYVRRQAEEIERHRHYAVMALPEDLDYGAVRGLSSEVRQKLAAVRPLLPDQRDCTPLVP